MVGSIGISVVSMKEWIALIFVLLLNGCLMEEAERSNKELVLRHLYETTKAYYANFDQRPDFEAAYRLAQDELNAHTTESEFFVICSRLLASLEDPHIRLVTPDSTFLTFNYLNYERTVDLARIKNHYLQGLYSENSRAVYGRLEQNIGYLYLPDFTDWTIYNQPPPEIQEAMNALRSTSGLIIDLRNNDGGSAIYAQALAAYFTQNQLLWHQSFNKNGPLPNDFDKAYQWFVNPSIHYYYNKPVIVLTSRYTVSAGERFVLAMKLLENATVIGQRTAGSQGSVRGFEMLNGWWFSLTFEKILDANGYNWDYLGIAPDREINTTLSQFPEGKDPLLEEAMEELGH